MQRAAWFILAFICTLVQTSAADSNLDLVLDTHPDVSGTTLLPENSASLLCNCNISDDTLMSKRIIIIFTSKVFPQRSWLEQL